MPHEIDISCSHPTYPLNRSDLLETLYHGLRVENVGNAVLSVSVVDNLMMHRLNREYLQHDYPTDVISFQLEWTSGDGVAGLPSRLPTGRSTDANIEGEIVVNADFAAEMAKQCGWSTKDELTLYAVHGMLHICGYDDQTDDEKEIMRAREKAVLLGIGLRPQYPGLFRGDDYPSVGGSAHRASVADDGSSGSSELAAGPTEGTQ
ncbi:MAG: rRNA maturation RNase YbeY [Fuerstiella sp.]|nr:rRNA maturation RNase YbeY [Fuerstiella sp.]MCP4505878.1 rRNA maturation RNase YbeY [Fuerstiella sp.]